MVQIIPAVLIISIFLGYLCPSLFYLRHFYPNTTLNGDDISGLSVKEVEEKLREAASGYSILVTGRGGKEVTIPAEAISFQPVFDGTLEQLLSSQKAFLWPSGYFKDSTFEAASFSDFSEEELESFLENSVFFDPSDVRQSVDAYYDFVDTKYEVIPEEPGTEPDPGKTFSTVGNAIKELSSSVDLDENDCYKPAAVTKDDTALNETVNKLNRYVGLSFYFDYGDNSETLDGTTIRDWITYDGSTVSLNTEEIKTFVDHLARAHDTFGLKRQFHTHDGRTITVSGGDYGWWTDRKSTTEKLTEAFETGEDGNFEPVYFGTAAVHGDSDIGSDYVEVDLDNQHVYVYQNGSLMVDSDCVSGKAINGNSTPEGTYAITYKERDGTLVGEGYSSSVNYWMPFNKNIGLHDATWRSEFGGRIYITNGSHGCVNLPLKKAEKIFEIVHKGEPVVVYGGEKKEDVSPPEPTEEELQQQLLEQLAAAAAEQAAGAGESVQEAGGETAEQGEAAGAEGQEAPGSEETAQ
ncbi:MAG: L,D-transpeptidase/peptidoglycan binding protein [Lachnospiraceae bacterium]|nr:L,D-transpeptidase/peptidoglycan binding protein [Lachnospiraceae bacterium]